jgi:hypothetical protein
VLADEFNNLPSGLVKISGSAANDGDYTVNSALASGADVEITLGTTLPGNQSGGRLNINEQFTYSCARDSNTIKVAFNLSGILYAGDSISIAGSNSVDGNYTIYAIDFNGTETEMVVEESIPADDNTGLFTYTKSFAITAVNGNKVTIKGGYEHKTVELLIDFIKDKFFSHEGFHVLEHILLRPKVSGPHFIDANSETLTEGLVNNGSLFFNKTLPIFSVSSSTNRIRVEGNISAELDVSSSTDISSEIYVSGTGVNDGAYIVKGVQYDIATDRTTIHTKEQIPADIPFTDPIGDISYYKGAAITSLSSANRSATIADPKSLEMVPGEIVEIRGSTDEINNGRYTVESISDLGTHQLVVISQVESEIQDKFLDIVLDEDDCDACQIQDPYTCVASVILPHWQGRFDNMDFRRFFERQIRLETPAHVFLNICWISCEQMHEFEEKYKAWLIENAKRTLDFGKLSARQNELVNILNQLRNIYPSGILHDCEEDETLENAIILNNSVLGNE